MPGGPQDAARTGQSAIATSHSTDKAEKLEFASLTEGLCTDAFYAFSCAAQDVTPDCLKSEVSPALAHSGPPHSDQDSSADPGREPM